MRYRLNKTKTKEYYQIVLNKTPFYGEMGGQIGDSGVLISSHGDTIRIYDTKKENNLIVHLADELPEHLDCDFTAEVDLDKRQAIANNHTATHLMHHALRHVLGNHVEQKGSLVTDNYFRFDFSHFAKIEQEDLRRVESLVNSLIRHNIPLESFVDIPIDEAKAMGAMALFGEKYGNLVRVVKFGDSVELCGGTHTSATGNIGIFKILSEGAIAAGIRRIEACTGEAVERMIYDYTDTIDTIKDLLNNHQDVLSAVKKHIAENESLKKDLEVAARERMKNIHTTLLDKHRVENGVHLFIVKGDFPNDFVKNLAFMFKDFDQNFAFISGTVNGGKPTLSLYLHNNLVKAGLHAGNIVREAAKLIQGGGGGQPFFATAGGKAPEHIAEAVDKIVEIVTSK